MAHLLRSLPIRRSVAYLSDIVLLFAVLGPTGLVMQRLLGVQPSTGPEIGLAIVVNFSLPAWFYFWLSDRSARGATVGKRLVRLAVRDRAGERLSAVRALLRIAVKLLPWELAHHSAFTLAPKIGEINSLQLAGLITANVLALAYLGAMLATSGRRSVHDWVAGTHVCSS